MGHGQGRKEELASNKYLSEAEAPKTTTSLMLASLEVGPKQRLCICIKCSCCVPTSIWPMPPGSPIHTPLSSNPHAQCAGAYELAYGMLHHQSFAVHANGIGALEIQYRKYRIR
jgi:hypothetical protein